VHKWKITAGTRSLEEQVPNQKKKFPGRPADEPGSNREGAGGEQGEEWQVLFTERGDGQAKKGRRRGTGEGSKKRKMELSGFRHGALTIP